MPSSIVGATYDLLEFEGSGNFGKFDRCFTKACAFHSFSPDDSARRKLRNVAFRHLIDAGYLDVSYTATTTNWSTAPANLVQRSEFDFVLVGGSAAADRLSRLAPRQHLRSIRSKDDGLVPEGVTFFPSTLQLTASLRDAEAFARATSVHLSPSYQVQFFTRLPSLRAVLATCAEEDTNSPMFEPDKTTRFSVRAASWEPYAETRPLESGLYRRSFDYGPPTYLVALMSPTRRVLRVKEREWVLVVALASLRLSLTAQYDRTRRRLLVSRIYHRALRLPTLLERSLRSGTLQRPSNTREWLVYDGIEPSSVLRLREKFPIFTIEETR